MENLPGDIITNIVSRLPADSILCAKQVCRNWNRSMIKTDTSFTKIHLHNHDYYADNDQQNDASRRKKKQRLNNDSAAIPVSFLFLAKSYGISPKKTTYYGEYSDHDDTFVFRAFTGPTSNLSRKLTVAPLPAKTTHTLVGSCNGLVCFGVSDSSRFIGNDPIYVCNPVTRQEWNLPRYNIIDRTYNYEVIYITSGFCYIPSTNQYKVVRIAHHPMKNPNDWIADFGNLQVFTLGVDSSWRHKEYLPNFLVNVQKSPNMQPGVVADGAIHWLDCLRWKIVAFSFVDEVVLEVPAPPCFDYEGSLYEKFFNLEVLRGCLCVIHRIPSYGSCSVDIWSFKKTNIGSCGISNGKISKEDSWSWNKEFSIAMEVEDLQYAPIPFAITKTGKILLWYNHTVLSVYDPETATLKKLADGGTGTFVYQTIPHVNSFVSL